MTRREQDERVLAMVGLRATGWSLRQIGQEMGAVPGNVAAMTNSVMDADIEHCGEAVAGAYWERRG